MLFRPAMREQHTCSDRVHTACDGEEPAIQFRTRLLIGLEQHPGRRHQNHGHDKEEASECGHHPEDDHPYAVSSAGSRGDSPKIACS
jgi:hypothetical protein